MGTDFDPGRPDGENASLRSAVSPDGTPEIGRVYSVPARCGVAVRVKAGQALDIVNTHGTQVCDFWTFNASDPDEHLSMEHLHGALQTIYPKAGDPLITNRRRSILDFEADTSPGIHDTVVAACDHHRYRQLGCTEYHDNCTDNLRMAMLAIGLEAPAIPAPFNIWMNTPVAADGSISWLAPKSRPGDRVRLRAAVDQIAVMSACPQDMVPVNGDDCLPRELEFSVVEA